MPEESLLKQAFTKCGEQLDRIIEAYERIPAADPNYPRYLKFDFDEDITMAVKIVEGLTIESIKKPSTIGSVSFNLRSANDECYIQYQELSEDPFTDILKFNLSTFAITGDLDSGVKTSNETWITEEEYNSLSLNEYPRYLLMEDFADSWSSPLFKIKTRPTNTFGFSPNNVEILGNYWFNQDFENPQWESVELPSNDCQIIDTGTNNEIQLMYCYDDSAPDTEIYFDKDTFAVDRNSFRGINSILVEMANPLSSDKDYQNKYKATWITPMRAKRIVAADTIVD